MVILPVPHLNLLFQDLNSNLEDKVNQACFVYSNKTNNNKDIQFDIHTKNTRKRKSQIAQDITDFICKLELTTTEEIVEVFTLSVKQLGLFDLFQFLRESTFSIFQNTLKELYCTYLDRNPNHSFSWGTFLAPEPFYVCTTTSKDVEMCVCKWHLHTQ